MMDVSRHKSVETLRGYVRMPSCSRITRAVGCFSVHAVCGDNWNFSKNASKALDRLGGNQLTSGSDYIGRAVHAQLKLDGIRMNVDAQS